MISVWEQSSFLSYDVIVIGAGISGLSTAASLKEAEPKLSVLVLERGTLPSGASTKNAGFACFGSVSELAKDQETLGSEGMVSLVEKRYAGLQKTIERLGADRIRFEKKGGYELLNPSNEHYIHKMDELNELLHPLFGDQVFSIEDDHLDTFGFRNTNHLIFNQYEGQVHTGEMMQSLWAYCNELGIRILTGTSADNLFKGPQGYQIQAGSYTFSAKRVAVCTNAFTNKLLSIKEEINPGRGMVLAIRPDQKLPFEGTFHYEEGYYYFRDLDGMLIFGGGRNLDIEGEQTTEFGLNAMIRRKLLMDLETTILPETNYEVLLEWSGIMAFGPNKAPIVKETSDGVFVGVRLGGMGLALGSLVGEELCEMIVSSGI
tara:strand:+ start:279 stop:1400 length:1122 start_codon:yes stop_codon:yes gene_type:complete